MADSIHLKLPDGSAKEVPKARLPWTSPGPIGTRLADAALIADSFTAARQRLFRLLVWDRRIATRNPSSLRRWAPPNEWP
jgi:hypothetical protein